MICRWCGAGASFSWKISLALYLARRKEDQILENIPPEVPVVSLPEDHLRPAERGQDEAEFAAFFGKCLAGQGDTA